jgi:large subunit ribosomal protein L4
MEKTVYNQEGKEVSKVKLPEQFFSVPWSDDMIHQTVTSMQQTKRQSTAKAKGRGEVRGGGKKPWRQKGTARARHGSARSLIWVGGGVSHGPTNERNFERKVNKKMKFKALCAILSRKNSDGEMLLIDQLDFNQPKTVEAKKTLEKLSTLENFGKLISKKINSALILLPAKNPAVEKSFNNIGNVEVMEFRNINPVELLSFKYLMIVGPDKALDFLESKSKAK